MTACAESVPLEAGVARRRLAWPWLLMALALPAASRRCAPRPLLWALLAATVAGALAIVMALRSGNADLAIAASIAISACVSGLYIVMGGLILGWACLLYTSRCV